MNENSYFKDAKPRNYCFLSLNLIVLKSVGFFLTSSNRAPGMSVTRTQNHPGSVAPGPWDEGMSGEHFTAH